MTPELTEGYARAKALTKQHSKTFFFASVALFGERRRAAFALYAFCRRLDDLVDGDNAGDGTVVAPSADPVELKKRLDLARAAVSSLYGNGSSDALPLHSSELAALRDTVTKYGIPELPFQELINGMEMDLTRSRYATYEELELYCYRVAGVVGLMMTPVLGYTDARCLPFAADLGTAMQLTNILRDVKEDLDRDRIYLPLDLLTAHGLTEADLRRGQVTDEWRGFAKEIITRARGLYARAEQGIPDLTGFGSQRLVRLMSTLYGHITYEIERRNYDVFTSRARVTFGGKVVLASKVLLTPNPTHKFPLPLGEGQGEGAR